MPRLPLPRDFIVSENFRLNAEIVL
ncbi:MAG: hypothetical protein K0R38_6867, partial [Polyangiaceae bacterium]|nr:hypothetical protein [Polyangiaceae bacterium]